MHMTLKVITASLFMTLSELCNGCFLKKIFKNNDEATVIKKFQLF